MMVFSCKNDYDTMLQIVPSAGFSPPSSTFNSSYLCDNLDQDFTPENVIDTDLSFSSTNTSSALQLSLYYDSNSLSSDVSVSLNSSKELSDLKISSSHFNDEIVNSNILEKFTRDHEKRLDEFLLQQFKEKEDISKNIFLDLEEMSDWELKCDWEKIRSENNFSQPVMSSSSTCSTSQNSTAVEVSEEMTELSCQKVDNNEKHVIERVKNNSGLLRAILETGPLNNDFSKNGKPGTEKKDKHKLLREVLQDTSFQKKYNLKPIDIRGVGTAFENENKIEDCMRNSNCSKEDVCDMHFNDGVISPMLSEAIEQLMQDVDQTCVNLGITRNPKKWSVKDVRSWLSWNSKQHNLPIPIELFDVNGEMLTLMKEREFQQRAPQCGNLLFAQLEIWKVNGFENSMNDSTRCDSNTSNISSMEISDEDEDETITTTPSCGSRSIQSNKMKMAIRGSGSHVHLWQFLKELLSSPQTHSSCIRWMDRSQGVFKIEDSVRVARLWGKRKNRPAMNYDKLSRSIRQYYRKGIMKKTERSQRLVYQFCSPYNL